MHCNACVKVCPKIPTYVYPLHQATSLMHLELYMDISVVPSCHCILHSNETELYTNTAHQTLILVSGFSSRFRQAVIGEYSD